MTEEHVIGNVLRGNVEAYDILVRKYAALLVGAARHIICNMDDAEDIAQETLLDAYKNLSTLKDHKAYRAWVFGILRFKCMDYLRRRKPETLNLDEYAEVIPAPEEEDTGDLMELLNALPLQEREILAARYIQDLDYKDIAETLGISEEAVRMRCSRARSRLRAINEKRIRQALGAFMMFPLNDGFTNHVMQHVKQTKVAPVTPIAGSSKMVGALMKIAVGFGVLAIGISVLLFCLSKPKPISSQVNNSIKYSQYQVNSKRGSGQMEPKIITIKEMTLVGMTSDGSDIRGLWMEYMKKEKDIKNKVEGTAYEWHAWSAHKCVVAAEVTEVEDVPEGLSVVHFPAGQYAVFTHRLANGGYEGLNSVMNHWLTTGPYEQISDISIQVFDERFKGGDQPDSEIDFWIPVKPRA